MTTDQAATTTATTNEGGNGAAPTTWTVWSRLRHFISSNSSVVGAFVVLGGLFIGQRWIGDWMAADRVIDENDIVAATLVPPADAQLVEETCDPWIPTFSDEFDGDSVDDERWIRYHSPGHAGNGLRRPEAIEVVDGNLVITGRNIDGQIVSGGMASHHQQMYGRFEARVRTEADPSETMIGAVITWPAGNYYPEGGENDFYETSVDGREPFFSHIHYPDGSNEEIVHNADAEEWHEMAIEWNEDAIHVFRDGDHIGTVTQPEAIPDFPHVLTVQLDARKPEMGEEFVDNEVRMYVDWVRVYQRNESLPDNC